jgi:PPOX class probable F420-dependent enzyme
MSNPRSGIKALDPNDLRAADVIERLTNDRVTWLTTVAPDGTPQTSPVWFLWSGDRILVYSRESPRVRNIGKHPRVSLNLDGNSLGGDIIVIEGTAVIDREQPAAADNTEYLSKYQPVIDDYGWTAEGFASDYSAPIIITPTKYRYW